MESKNIGFSSVSLKDMTSGRMEEISAPAGHKIHFLDLIG